jgi:hypothetical protein
MQDIEFVAVIVRLMKYVKGCGLNNFIRRITHITRNAKLWRLWLCRNTYLYNTLSPAP